MSFAAEPCRCLEFDPACPRAGAPMNRMLWDRCRGVGCDPESSEAYRWGWDHAAGRAGRGVGQLAPCSHLGGPTGETVSCPSCPKGRVQLKLLACDKHGSCTLARPVADRACCATCTDHTGRPETVYVRMRTRGLGDTIQGLFALAGLRRDRPAARIVYGVEPPNLVWMRTLFHRNFDELRAVRRTVPGATVYQPYDTYGPEIRTRGATPRWLAYAERCQTTPATPLVDLPAAEMDEARRLAGVVILSPVAAWSNRSWDLAHWLQLEQLLIRAGIPVLVLDGPGDGARTAAFRSLRYWGQRPALVAAWVKQARCVVANDSGLAHLAGVLGTPTFALCGAARGEQIYGCYPSVRVLQGPLPCSGCYWHGPFYTPQCNTSCASLQAITPETVCRAVAEGIRESHMETAKARPRRISEGWFEKYVRDPGLDIGCGPDPLSPTFRRWDLLRGDGDGTHLEGVPDGIFATVYASHVLEHLDQPQLALRHWYRVLRPGGNLIVVVPHRDLYEKRTELPSRFNADHRSFWLPDREEPPVTRSLLHVVREALPGAEVVELRALDEGFVSGGPEVHSAGEYSIEVIVRKPSA